MFRTPWNSVIWHSFVEAKYSESENTTCLAPKRLGFGQNEIVSNDTVWCLLNTTIPIMELLEPLKLYLPDPPKKCHMRLFGGSYVQQFLICHFCSPTNIVFSFLEKRVIWHCLVVDKFSNSKSTTFSALKILYFQPLEKNVIWHCLVVPKYSNFVNTTSSTSKISVLDPLL